MAASQFCAYPNYSALILRDTFVNLWQPGGIMHRAVSWWADRYGVRWSSKESRLTWPSGATISFGHMSHALAHLNYQGAELQYIGIDEATAIPQNQIEYLHSRLRKHPDNPVPLRFRLATNPGGKSHDFIRDQYVRGADGKSTVYLPALLSENPGIDQETYRAELARISDPTTRKQLEEGDWDIFNSGGFFDIENLTKCDCDPRSGNPRVRAWDLAATAEVGGNDPDYSVGILMAKVRGEYHIHDMKRFRAGPAQVEQVIAQTAAADGRDVKVLVEQEPGSSGKIAIMHIAKNVLPGYDFYAVRPTGPKIERAKPVASAIRNDIVRWTDNDTQRLIAIAELRAFSEDDKEYAHDDIVDAVSMAYNELAASGLVMAIA